MQSDTKYTDETIRYSIVNITPGVLYQKGPDRLAYQILTVPATINPEKWPAVGFRPGSILLEFC